MAEDWAVNVKKYDPAADDGVIAGIVRHCGIALRSRDASLVSFGDKEETDRVRDSFLKKKLGLTQDNATLDAAIAEVGQTMHGESFKNRVTVYYLLAKKFGLLHLFSGAGGAATATSAAEPVAPAATAAAAGVGAAALGAAATAGDAVKSAVGTVGDAVSGAGHAAVDAGKAGLAAAAGLGAAGLAATGLGSHGDDHAAAAPVATPTAPAYSAEPVAAAYDDGAGGGGFGKILPWLIGLLALGALAWYLFGRSHGDQDVAPLASATAEASAPAADASVDASTPAAAPSLSANGEGVTTETVDGKPVVKVYFATGKTTIPAAFKDATTTLKSYADAHPGTNFAISGFADKTGNAALNAELSKNRAKVVQAEMVGAGIAETATALEKPADITADKANNTESRRVEVHVK